jgi:hypothetical protein
MVPILRNKTGAQRLQIASGMFHSARQMLRATMQKRNPDWNDAAIDQEVAWRLSHGACGPRPIPIARPQ